MGTSEMTMQEIRTIDVGGQRLKIADFGPKDALRTLLVFNGIGANLETIAPFAAHFRDTRVVTFDVPGVGGSATPALPYRFTWLSRLAARALNELGIGNVHVFGVSWGGALAQQFARDFPGRAMTLTLAATSAGFVMVPGHLGVLMKLATPQRYSDPEHMMKIGPDIYGGQLRFNAALLKEHVGMMRSTSARGYLYQLLAGAGWTSWFWLPRLQLPVLIMMGTDDPIVPVINGRMLAKRLPNAQLKLMDCGHLFILTDPGGTAATVEAFLHENEDSSSR